MPQNQSHTNINDDESITHTFIRENQSLLQVIPSAYTTKERQQNDNFQAGVVNNQKQGLISNDSNENLQQKAIGSARIQVYGQHAQEANNKRSRQQFTNRKNPYSDSMTSLNNDNNKSLGKNGKSRSLSQVSITLKESTKANQEKVQQTIPLQLNSYLSQNLNEKPQQSREVQQDQQVNISQLLQINLDLRNEFQYFKSETNERISELEMKHLNQQEIIDYLLQLLQGQGVNVFNKQDLKDDSIKDSIQIRKEKLQMLKNEQVLGQDSQNAHSGSENDQQNQKSETENLYYFSQEEMFKHNETSNYEDARIRNVSEPDIVNRMPLDDDDDNDQNDEQQQNSDNNTQSQMSSKEQTTQSNMNLMISGIGMGADSDQDEVQIQATNFDYNYMTNNQDEQQQNVLTPLSQNQQSYVNESSKEAQELNSSQQQSSSKDIQSISNKLIIIDLQNQSYPSNKLMQQQYSTFHREQQLDYISANSVNFNQYLQNNQSKFVEKPINLIQSIESQEELIHSQRDNLEIIESNEVTSRLYDSQKLQDYNFQDDNNFENKQYLKVENQENNRYVQKLAINRQMIEDECILSLGSSPTHRNRENFEVNLTKNNYLSRCDKTSSSQQQLNDLNNFDDSQLIVSPQVDEEQTINHQSLSSNHVSSSNLDNKGYAYKLQDQSRNFDSIDKTTLLGYTEQGGGNQFSSKNTFTLLTNTTNQMKPIFNYQQQQLQNEQSNNKNFSSADKTSSKINQQNLRQKHFIDEDLNQMATQAQIQYKPHDFLNKEFTQNKINSRSRSQMGFSTFNKRIGISGTQEMLPNNSNLYFGNSQTNYSQYHQMQSYNHLYDKISISKVDKKIGISRDSEILNSYASRNSKYQQCCQNMSRSSEHLGSNNGSNNFNYCCQIQLQRSVEQAYSCDLRFLQDMTVVLNFLNKNQGQILLSDLFSKNVNQSLQRELIQDLVNQFIMNQNDYQNLYIIPTPWWKEWCKYTNYTDNYFAQDIAKAFQTGKAPITKIPIKNFNDLVKGKRPESIKNFALLSSDCQSIISDQYISVSIDIWSFLSAWYDADLQIKVTPLSQQFQSLSIKPQYKQRNNSLNQLSSCKYDRQQVIDSINLASASNQQIPKINDNNPISPQIIHQNMQIKGGMLSKQMTGNTFKTQLQSEKTVFQVNPDEALSTPTYNHNSNMNFDGQQYKRSSSDKDRKLNQRQEDDIKLSVQSTKQVIQTDRNTVRNM
eukprot:403332172